MKKLLRLVDGVTFYVLAILMIALVSVLFLNVVFRFLLHLPLNWAEEVSLILIVWIVFTGVIVLQRNEAHLKVDFIYDLFPRPARWVMDQLGRLLILIALGVTVLSSIDLVELQSRSMTVNMGWNAAIFGTAVLVGSIGMFLFALVTMIVRVSQVLRRND